MSVVQRLAEATALAGGPEGAENPHPAENRLRAALDDAAAVLDPGDPRLLAAIRALAALHRRLGAPARARTLLEQGLAAGRDRHGEADAMVLALSHDLAVVTAELSNVFEARRNFARVRRFGPLVLGPDHEYVLTATRYLQNGASATAWPEPSPPPPSLSVPPARLPGPRPSDAPPGELEPSWPDPLLIRPAAVPGPPTDPRLFWVDSPASHPGVTGVEPVETGTRNRMLISLTALVLVLVAVASVLGSRLFLADRDAGEPTVFASVDSTTSSAVTAPIRLDLRDAGSTVTLTWNDPSNGRVLFVVAYGRADGPADKTHRLSPGTTMITINGLNPAFDYCFTVAGIETTTTIVLSPVVCTRRANGDAPSGGTSTSPSSSR